MNEVSGKEKKWSEWFEIPTLDMDRAKTFYETIFETQIHVMELAPMFKMGIFPHSGVGCALVYNPDFYKPVDGGVTVYLNANPDLQEVLDRIESAGGNILVPKKQIDEEHGYMALFIDSEGNRMALHSAK
jgi:predicted enzyme related to lactoylglutathione lyase